MLFKGHRTSPQGRLGFKTVRERAEKCDDIVHFLLGQTEVAKLLTR